MELPADFSAIDPDTPDHRKKIDAIVFLSFFFLLLAIGLPATLRQTTERDELFAFEYGNIAASLAQGKGYANPFPVETGPTAWMPPVYPTLLAVLFWLFGIKTNAALLALLVVKYAGLSLVAVLLLRLSRSSFPGKVSLVILPVYFLLLCAYFGTFFLYTHDEWFLILVLMVLLHQHSSSNSQSSSRTAVLSWGILGGFSILASPVLGLVYGVLTMLPRMKMDLIRRAGALVVSAVVVFPWCLRNNWTFGEPTWIKSNLYYELYQNTYLDADGICDKTTSATHPYFNDSSRSALATQGESSFMRQYRMLFLQGLQQDPMVFLRKVFNRFLHIFLVYPEEDRTGARYFVKAVVHAMPFVIVLISLFSRVLIKYQIVPTVIAVYFTYALPYGIIGYYKRYSMPLLPLFAILYVCAFACILDLIDRRRRSEPRI